MGQRSSASRAVLSLARIPDRKLTGTPELHRQDFVRINCDGSSMAHYSGTRAGLATTAVRAARGGRPIVRASAWLAPFALGALAAGCATYHPAPLPSKPDLAPRLAQLRLELPAADGEPAARIDVDRPLEIDQVGLLALLNDPELRAQQGESQVARANEQQASALPNPSLTLTWEAVLAGPGTVPSWAVSLTEDIAALVTYHARVKAAQALTQQVAAQQLWEQWQVVEKARALALDIYWAGQSIVLSEQERELIERDLSATRRALSDGNLDYSALAPLLAAQAALDQSLAALRLDSESNWQALDSLLGLESGVRFAIAAPDLPPIPADVDALIASLPQRRPDLLALQLGYRASDEGVRAAVLGQFPAFTLGPIWEQDTSNIRSIGPTAVFELPIFHHHRAAVAQANASRLVLREQYQARLDSAVAEARTLLALAERTSRDIAQARAAASAALELAVAARAAYAQGNLDHRSLSDYESAALERELRTASLARSLGEAQIGLTVNLGIGLPRAAAPLPGAETVEP